MPRSTNQLVATVAALVALVLLVTVVAGAVLGGSVTPNPGPSASPTLPPSAEPSEEPISPPPSAEPSTPPAGRFEVDLRNSSGHDLSIVIEDQTGLVVEAISGFPGDGMSVRWFDVAIENVDDRTVQITWAGLPGDGQAQLNVSRLEDGAFRLRFVQPVPPPNSDAMGEDRVLVLAFAEPVEAHQLLATIQGGLDTDD
jgi:hypothetical protein